MSNIGPGTNNGGGAFSSPPPVSALPGFAFDEEQEWLPHSDAALGFAVDHPGGWEVSADAHHILVQSPDQADFVLAVSFQDSSGDCAAVLSGFAAAYPALLPQARLEKVTPQPPPSGGAQAVGFLVYQNAAGQAGQARALCSVSPQGSGMVYVLAAPQNQFDRDRPTLLRIVQSLRFGLASAAASGAESNAPDLTFVSWTDPREGAFHVEVPQGWVVEGGLFRFGPTDVRKSIQVRSPQGDLFLQIGDPNLTSFNLPTQMLWQMGLREGQTYSPTGTFQATIARFMPPLEFNRWYLQNAIGRQLANLALVREQFSPELSLQETEKVNRNAAQLGMQIEVTVGETEFTGVARANQVAVTGKLVTCINRFPPDPMGGGMWTAAPLYTIYPNEDKAEVHLATLNTVLEHIKQTWRDDPLWMQRDSALQGQILQGQQQSNDQFTRQLQQNHQTAMENIRQAGERSRMIAQQADERRAAGMHSFRERMHAQDNNTRQFVNYIGDRTDVRDPGTGQAWNVGSGYSHYYRNERTDTIIGTNSVTDPGVDFTPLKEF